MQAVPFLTFNGNCREAMLYYKKCLGGILRFQTIGESPLSAGMPDKMKKCILQATLTKDDFIIYGTDLNTDEGFKKGNSVSIVIKSNSSRKLKSIFKKLSADSKEVHPIDFNTINKSGGSLKDQFGIHWIILKAS